LRLERGAEPKLPGLIGASVPSFLGLAALHGLRLLNLNLTL